MNTEAHAPKVEPLSKRQQSIVTIAALVSLGGVEPMLQAHFGMGLNTGLTGPQLQQLLALAEAGIGKKEAEAGRAVLVKALDGNKK